MIDLNLPVTELNGVGKKKAEKYRKLGILTLSDLLYDWPRRYDERPYISTIARAAEGRMAFVAQVRGNFKSGANGTVKLWINDGTGRALLMWFRNPWVSRMIKSGEKYAFIGFVNIWNGMITMAQPEFVKADEYAPEQGSLIPVYRLKAGITNAERFTDIKQLLPMIEELPDPLPEDARIRYGLMSRLDAVRCTHYPANGEIARQARRRIAFDEFFSLLYKVKEAGMDTGENEFRIKDGSAAEDIENAMPFELTNSQKSAVRDIISDFSGENVSVRLIQGDVGSGKTAVALIAAALMADSGFQTALMAPTAVLAEQHFATFKETLNRAGKLDQWNPVLLTGSVKGKEKERIKKDIESGKSLIAIGTQALIQEDVHFKALGLTIADEQHRFGVDQREELSKRQKAKPHCLLMTATPIPRTTAQLLFGGIDLTIMKDKPADRLPIKTAAVTESQRNKVDALLEREISRGRQAYIICPMVEGDDDGKKSVEECAKSFIGRHPAISYGILHGKMKDIEKTKAMNDFAEGITKVLISTTVVEVGVNVPNATLIIIEGADNFGLLQLHQLRGRVGRGREQSYCILFGRGNSPSEKLITVASTNDGFKIAEADYKARKAGTLFGTKQSGDMGFKIADIVRDEDLLRMANEEAEREIKLRKEENKQKTA